MAKTQPPSAKKDSLPKSDFSFGRINYILMLSGIGLIILGFILMAGGKSDDPNVFNPDVFSFRRITLAPIIVLSGFALNIYAILKKSKD
jgi:membrane-bound ClpP family serine protease